MFEKEAEDYSIEHCNGLVDSKDMEMLAVAYQDGAEFGYNKANEWHYLKDDYPPLKNQESICTYRLHSADRNSVTGEKLPCIKSGNRFTILCRLHK